MDPVWYVKVKGKKYGPFTREKLDALLQAGKVTVETPACTGDSPEWLTIGVLFAAPASVPESVTVPEPVPAAVIDTAPAEEVSKRPTHDVSIILLGIATVVGVVIFWLDLYLPALRLSLCVVTAASVAVTLRFLIAAAFSRMESDGARNRRLIQLVLVAVSAGSLLGGLGWYERSAVARTRSVKKSQVTDSSSLAETERRVTPQSVVEPGPPPRRSRPAGPSAAEIAEQKRQEENAQAMQFLGAILQGAANEQTRSSQGQPCPACGGSGSYSYVDGAGRLQVSQCPHCSGSGKKWGGRGLFGPP